MAINKVDFCGQTLIDLSQDTVTPEALQQGFTAHDKTGTEIQGTKSKEIAFIEYGVTSFEEVLSLYSSGVYIICVNRVQNDISDIYTPMSFPTEQNGKLTAFSFCMVSPSSTSMYGVKMILHAQKGWSFRDVTLQDDIPECTAEDAGKFLRVNTAGFVEWQTVPNANGVNFGG